MGLSQESVWFYRHCTCFTRRPFGSCAGSLRFLKSLQSILGPKYHLKSYIIRPISVLYLCGTNVLVPVWQSCDGSNYMSSQRPTASQFLKICHSQELIVDATAPVNECINWLNVRFSLIFDIRHSIWMLDLVLYSIFDIQNLNVGFSLIFDIRHSIWMLDLVRYSIFDIWFECWIQFDIRYSTFDLNVGFSLIFDIQHSIWMLDWVWYSIFDIRFECWI